MIEGFLARDATDPIEDRARELHDQEADLWPPPHAKWDDCNEAHRERYGELARAEAAGR